MQRPRSTERGRCGLAISVPNLQLTLKDQCSILSSIGES
jgi:hypothetical protein